MTQQPGQRPDVANPPVCYRHPDRETYIRCVRCDRPICPDCMIPASVGFQCPDEVAAANRERREARTVFGGRVADPGYVSKALLGVTIAAYLLQQVLGAAFTNRLLMLGLFPAPELPGSIGVATGEWYRLLTAAFLHGSLLHLAFNMYALYLFGPQLEAVFGRLRFVLLYAGSALGGSAATYVFSRPQQPSLGASGAIFGLFAAYLVVSRRLGRDTSALLVLLGINVVLGFVVPNIDWRAHAGGFVAGGLIAVAIVWAPRARRTLVQATGTALVLLGVLIAVTLRTAALTAGF